MKKLRILFQGDSITDAGRDRRNYFDLGHGYASVAAPLIREAHPELDIEFINLGISGNRTDQLFDRIKYDAVDLQPDIVSVLIGINDIWHRYGGDRIATTDLETTVYADYNEQYQSFALIALFLLMIEFFIMSRKNHRLTRMDLFKENSNS